jgi:hypothetical protein
VDGWGDQADGHAKRTPEKGKEYDFGVPYDAPGEGAGGSPTPTGTGSS